MGTALLTGKLHHIEYEGDFEALLAKWAPTPHTEKSVEPPSKFLEVCTPKFLEVPGATDFVEKVKQFHKATSS